MSAAPQTDKLAEALDRLATITEQNQRFQQELWLALPAKTRAKILGVGKDRERTLRQRLEAQRQLSSR